MRGLPSFLLSLALVSVLVNKVVLCLEFLNFCSLSTYFWLPSVFFSDLLFLGIVYYGLQCSKHSSLFIILMIAVVFTALVVSVQVTAALGYRKTVPWNLSVWMFAEWDHFRMMMRAKASEAYIQVWMVALLQVIWTFLLTMWLSRRQKPALPHVHVAQRSPRSLTRMSRYIKPTALFLVYLLLVLTVRPDTPYQNLSKTPCFAVPIEILKGVKDYHGHKHHYAVEGATTVQRAPTKVSNITTGFEPLNVVLIFLESVRADIMPFDGSTRWAKRFVPSQVRDDITPFYSNFVTSEDTLYIPLIKTASGLTHKSLLSTLCSMHALPIQGTVEPFYSLYHACLPQLLAQYNYSSIFAQPQTEEFEHQRDLIQRIGYPTFFGKESYENMTQPSDEFRTNHTANYFGYEDNVMLPVLMKWVEQQTGPFFLSYLCGITHDPHNIPSAMDWKSRRYSSDEKVNGYLNTVNYMDHWLKALYADFEKRNLLNSTLFVILGDHGGTFYDRNSDFGAFDVKYEEAMNVGVSFHSKSRRWKQLLEAGRPNVANGNYSSIDVVPTVLEILGIGNESLRDGKHNGSWVDGRSMLHPSGQRLRLSIPNPGYTMVLRDRSFVLVRRLYDTPEAFDVSVDPEQKNPLFIAPGGKVQKGEADLASWGEKAVLFLQYLESDLQVSYGAGQRCQNCTLSLLLSLESLDEWDPEMAVRATYPPFSGDDYDQQWEEEDQNVESEYNNER